MEIIVIVVLLAALLGVVFLLIQSQGRLGAKAVEISRLTAEREALDVAQKKHDEQIKVLSDRCSSLEGQLDASREKEKELNATCAVGLSTNEQKTAQLDDERKKTAKLEEQLAESRTHATELAAANAKLREQVRLITEEQEKLREESRLVFQDVATKIIDEQRQKFKEKNETRLDEILTPFKENLESFKKQLIDYDKAQTQYSTSLQQQIKDLSEMNRNIGEEAKELSNALRGNSKVQGDWGEMILEQILSVSGLQKGLNYDIQATRVEGAAVRSEEGGSQRPDLVLFLPDKKNLVIDSKVSLTAYTRFVNSADPIEQNDALKEHLRSVKKHIDELAGKSYQKKVANSADFVMMFMPHEAAYLAAMQESVRTGDNLWEYAYSRQVVIVSPTHLISVVKLISQLWSRENQTKNALRIAEEAGKMLDKFSAFVADLDGVGEALGKAQRAYEGARGKLSDGKGNLLRRAQQIQDLGVKTAKQLPQPESEE